MEGGWPWSSLSNFYSLHLPAGEKLSIEIPPHRNSSPGLRGAVLRSVFLAALRHRQKIRNNGLGQDGTRICMNHTALSGCLPHAFLLVCCAGNVQPL